MLLLRDVEVSKKIINLLERHFSSHYCLTKMIDSGIVQYLILNLDNTDLANISLDLLLKLQDVSISYNDPALS